MIPRPEFGNMKLSDPRLSRLLDRQQAHLRLVDATLRDLERGRPVPAAHTKYLVQRKSDHFYFAAESCGLIGDVWIGNRALAYRFDFESIAELRILKFQQSAALFDVVPVEG